MKKRLKTVVKWVFVYPIVFVVCLELALQILGWGTFYREDYSIHTEPKNAFVGNPELGIQLNQGSYHVTINDSVQFRATHLPGNHRWVPGSQSAENPEVLLLGCSFTYGYGVNDQESFAALLQQEFPEVSLRNEGVVGYGTVQSLLQLREAIQKDRLKAVLLNFSSFHLMRNGLSPIYRANLKVGYENSSKEVESLMAQSRFPYVKDCGLEIYHQPWETMYSNWKWRDWSAIVNWRQLADDRKKREHIDELALAACLINEMRALCDSKGIAFGVVSLDETKETLSLEEKLEETEWMHVGFDFTDPAYTNLPYDSHPSAEGHRYIARHISPFLKQLLNGQSR